MYNDDKFDERWEQHIKRLKESAVKVTQQNEAVSDFTQWDDAAERVRPPTNRTCSRCGGTGEMNTPQSMKAGMCNNCRRVEQHLIAALEAEFNKLDHELTDILYDREAGTMSDHDAARASAIRKRLKQIAPDLRSAGLLDHEELRMLMGESYDDDDDRSMFADPGGKSALRAASKRNPRNLPCPTCKEPNRLTPKDKRLGYQCDACADRDEGVGY